jgi:uncharacterized protein (TIRG00374 family)
MGNKAWVIVQAAVTVLLLAVLFRGLDIAALRALFAAVPPWYYLLSLLVIVAGQVLYAWRWRLLLVANDIPVGLSTVVRQYFVGTFVNNFLPSTVGGDLAKVYYLGREHGYRPIAASVVLDRLLGIGLLALIASVTAWSVTLTSPALLTARIAVSAIGAGAIAALAIAVYGTGGLQRRVERLGPRLSQVAAHLRQFRVDMAMAAARPAVLLQALGAILAYFLAVVVLYQTFFRLMTPGTPPFLTLMAAVTMTSVLSNVPISLNGLGLREQLHVALLQPLGVPVEAAVAISMLLYAHLLVVSLCGLVIWMRSPVVPAHVSERAEV